MPYRLHDIDLREPLFEWVEARLGKVRILEEVEIGRSRADALLVTDAGLIGMEIKSDADTYARLERQVPDYDRYFDANVVVVGGSHTQVARHVPESWGIVVAQPPEAGTLPFELARPHQPSPRTSRARKLSLLWRPELARIQELTGMPRYAQKSKAFVAKKILEKVDPEQLDRLIVDALFERDYTTIADELAAYRLAHR